MTARKVFIATIVVLATVFAVYLAYRLLQILILLGIAFVLGSAIAPFVSRLNRWLPLGFSILAVYIVLIGVVSAIMSIIIPSVVSQTTLLINSAPELLDQAQQTLTQIQESLNLPENYFAPDLTGSFGEIAQRIPAVAAGVLNFTLGIFSGLAGVLVVLVVTFYWLLERRNIESTWMSLIPARNRGMGREILEEIEIKLGGYVRGQLALAVIIGVMSYVGLTILGVPYTLVLALIAAISELIPIVGPIIGAVPAVLIGLAESPIEALIVAGLYLIIQQLENHLLVPNVMKRSVGLSPLTVLVSVLAGTTLLGIVGALLAVPVASVLYVIAQYTLFRPNDVPVQSR